MMLEAWYKAKHSLLPAEGSDKPKLMTKLKERFYNYLTRVKQLQGDPHYIAKGVALGVFIGIMPIVPLHTVSAVALAFIFKASKPAAAIGVWVSNPLTLPFLYYACFKVGHFFFKHANGFNPKIESIIELFNRGLELGYVMITGGIILGVLPAIAAYFIALKSFKTIRDRRLAKRTHKRS